METLYDTLGFAMIENAALLTDLYELTMMQGYHRCGFRRRGVFDLFFRRAPFGGGFSVAAGLDDALGALEGLAFEAGDLEYLESLGFFGRDFLDYLADFRFSGEVWAVPEGTVVFPHEPLLRVSAPMIEGQLIESLLLNTINYQTLVATKTARIYLASGKGSIAEFGLRRAQGWDGALTASRAAYIGGAGATSNTLAGRHYGIPVTGTMSHSWIMAFESELEAFERYAEFYPDQTTLLLDTYDTLGSGLPNAVAVARRLVGEGHKAGVRLDSGDIQYLSKAVRRGLDEAGLQGVTIAVSNELDEHIIAQLTAAGSPVDLWGVGTQMVTGGGESSLTGVYKLAAVENAQGAMQPTMKFSDNPEKSTNPGMKQVYRFYGGDGAPLADLIALDDESFRLGEARTFYHPAIDYRKFRLETYADFEALLRPVMRDGRRVEDSPSLEGIRRRTLESLDSLDETYTRIINPHVYKVSISARLKEVKQNLIRAFRPDVE